MLKNTRRNDAYTETVNIAGRTQGGDYTTQRSAIRNLRVAVGDEDVKSRLEDLYKNYYRADKLEEWNLIDSNGKLINNFEGVAKKLYQYNKQGNITDIELFDEDDVVVRKILYKYGKDGRLIESVIFFVKFMFGKVHEIPLEKSSFHYESW